MLHKDTCFKCYLKRFWRFYRDVPVKEAEKMFTKDCWGDKRTGFCLEAGLTGMTKEDDPPSSCPHLFEHAVLSGMTANVCSK